jgi:tetratricopeptide (TPR) repeat protein
MKYTLLVEKYLDGELKGEELRNFELEILKNPEVAEEVERIRNLDAFSRKQYARSTATQELLEDPNEIPHFLDESSLKNDLEIMKIQKINELDPDYHDFRRKVKAVSLQHYFKFTAKNTIIVPGYIIWIAAACFAFLIAISLLNIFTGNKPENLHNVYSSFYDPYPADLPVRDKAFVPTDPYTMGLNEYLKSNYGSALSYFNEVESGSINYKSIYLLKGICLMETANFEDAILVFRNLSNNPILNDYGQWYTGLCYIELQLPEKARELFKELSRREGYYRKMSRQVLKNL